jgi:hypothetical protein
MLTVQNAPRAFPAPKRRSWSQRGPCRAEVASELDTILTYTTWQALDHRSDRRLRLDPR